MSSTALQGPFPLATLRGHAFGVTCLAWHSNNNLLVSGDEGGWTIVWSVLQRRPLLIWRSHTKAIVAVKWINDTKILTHGRDHKLFIFDLSLDIEIAAATYRNGPTFDVNLPSQSDDGLSWRKPWMVHAQSVNALNFCGAAVWENFIAVPSTLSSEKIDVYRVESGLSRLYTLEPGISTGIVMCLLITSTQVVAGFESGHVVSFTLDTGNVVYVNKSHTQPVLSLAQFDDNLFLSCGADSNIVKHEVKFHHDFQLSAAVDILSLKHNGLTSIDVRSDKKLFATAGWDAMVRVFQAKTMKNLAAWKISEGVSAIAFSNMLPDAANPAALQPHSLELHSDGISQQLESLRLDKQTALSSLIDQRMKQEFKQRHWLAVAGKNGRISLYDLY